MPPPTQLPPPEVTIPTKPEVSETTLPAQTPKPPSKHKKPPANPTPETQQAAERNPGGERHRPALLGRSRPTFAARPKASIAATERGLNGINRSLNDQEQKTAAHIREFLKQAKAALASGDVDGASTLAAKAKVLLTELQH